MYFNTTALTGEALKKAVAAAKNQEEAILLIFKNSSRSFSPSEIHSLCGKAGHHYLKTSVRRAISNLTDEERLTNTGEQVPGPHGRPEGKWVYNAAWTPENAPKRMLVIHHRILDYKTN